MREKNSIKNSVSTLFLEKLSRAEEESLFTHRNSTGGFGRRQTATEAASVPTKPGSNLGRLLGQFLTFESRCVYAIL